MLTWFNPTGGLIYHLKALNYRHSLWRNFRSEIAAWLTEWHVREQHLILVGPSGGYCLCENFLSRFESIVAVDPDPLAKLIFKIRFRKTLREKKIQLEWVRADILSPRNEIYDPLPFACLLDQYPGHAVLFCNFLGQARFLTRLEIPHESFSDWKAALTDLVSPRSWASFHDRYSGESKPRLRTISLNNELSEEQISEEFYPQGGEIFDHLTHGLFPGKDFRYFSWEISPGYYHLIQGVRRDRASERPPEL